MERQQKVRKNNISRVARLKKQRRKRRISLLICGVLVIGVGFFIGYKLYIKNKPILPTYYKKEQILWSVFPVVISVLFSYRFYL